MQKQTCSCIAVTLHTHSGGSIHVTKLTPITVCMCTCTQSCSILKPDWLEGVD